MCTCMRARACMDTWKASLLPACEPPLMTLKHGTGSTIGPVFPASAAMCLYNGMPFASAAALQAAIDTPRIAFAPSLDLLGVPSSSHILLSSASCSNTDMPFKASFSVVFTDSTALVTPLPR